MTNYFDNVTVFCTECGSIMYKQYGESTAESHYCPKCHRTTSEPAKKTIEVIYSDKTEIQLYQIDFKTLKNICKYCKPGYDEMVGKTINTCRKEDNSTKDGSWGDCDETVCPLIKPSHK